jgi:uncharacterized protein YcbX
MPMLLISELYIYPIKSLGGIALIEAKVTERGLEHDRRWMLIDENNRFLSQRENQQMALLKVSITDNNLLVTNTTNNTSISIPFAPLNKVTCIVSIWDDTCIAQYVNDEADEWFTQALGLNCRLVYMPDVTRRQVDEQYSPTNKITSFSDAFPFLLLGQASVNDLNDRLIDDLPINRFRPNIVFTGGKAFEEDLMQHITIAGISFYGAKLCARCLMITIDQQTGSKAKEPLKTLATYRLKNNKIMFGQNLVHIGDGVIKIGDSLNVLSTHYEERFIVTA